jgi:rubredoxin-NAD+ reductase
MKPLIIIGTGLAGYTLAREWRKLETNRPLIMISTDAGGFYSKPMLSNALAQGREPSSLVNKTAEQMQQELDARILTHQQVSSIDPVQKTVDCQGERYSYEQLVLAVGANPIRLPISGNAADTILSVNSLQDYAVFRERLEQAQAVTILGAGLIGCEFADDLLSSGKTVHIIDPAKWPLGRLLPETSGNALKQALQDSGAQWHLEKTLEFIDANISGYRLTLSDQGTLESDLVLSAVGLKPNLTLATQSETQTNRGIRTNRLLQTSKKDIYALGDCAEVEGLVLPYVMPIMHAARALAKTLSGTPTEVVYPAMPVLVKTPSCPTIVAPPALNAAGDWVVEAKGINTEAHFKGPDGQLLGFALTGTRTNRKQALTAELPAVLQ